MTQDIKEAELPDGGLLDGAAEEEEGPAQAGQEQPAAAAAAAHVPLVHAHPAPPTEDASRWV